MEDLEKIKEWIKIAENKYFKGEIKQAHKLFLKCEVLAKEIGNEEWIAETKKNVGRTFHRLGKYKEAKVRYIEAIEIINRLNIVHKKPRYLNHLANVYQYLLMFEKYYECLIEALEISEKLDDRYFIAKIRSSLGVYYEVMGDYNKALNYLEDALKLYNEVGAMDYIFAGTYNIISSVLTKKKKFNEAIKYSEKAYILSVKNNDLNNKAYSLRNRIRCLYLQGNYGESVKYFDELLKVKDQIENIKMKSEFLRLIGQIYQKTNDLKNSYRYYQESLKIAKDLNFYHGMAETYKALGEFYNNLKQYSEAYRNFSNSLNTYEKILNSIENPKMKEYYKQKFIDLPETIKKINDILENQPFEIKFNDVERIPENAVNICKKVQNSNINEIVAKDCLEYTKKLNKTSEEIKKERENYKKIWIKILKEECFSKLDNETQDHLIRFRETLDKMPDDYRSCIRKIADAIECELRIKLFLSVREKLLKNLNEEINIDELGKNEKRFRDTLFVFKKFLMYSRLPSLGEIYRIISLVHKLDSYNHIPERYLKPFKLFKTLIGEKNINKLKKILTFFEYRFKCGVKSYPFVKIRNICSHGGGRIQDKRRGLEINLSRDIIKSIESKLINEDTELLLNLCTFEV